MCTAKDHRFHSAFVALVLLAILSAFGATHQAQAATVEWTLNNASFTDGDVVTGSFVWDTNLQNLVSWDFTVSGGGTTDFPSPFTYSDAQTDHAAFAVTQDSNNVLRFNSAEFNGFSNLRHIRFGIEEFNLLDTPVAMLALFSNPLTPTGLTECYNCSPFRTALEGAFLSSVVPIPAALWLFGTALVGLIGFSKKRKAG